VDYIVVFTTIEIQWKRSLARRRGPENESRRLISSGEGKPPLPGHGALVLGKNVYPRTGDLRGKGGSSASRRKATTMQGGRGGCLKRLGRGGQACSASDESSNLGLSSKPRGEIWYKRKKGKSSSQRRVGAIGRRGIEERRACSCHGSPSRIGVLMLGGA